MAVKPSDQYSPVASVEPTTAAPQDYNTTRANPNEFGAQVGQAIQGLGNTINQAGAQQADIHLQKVGMANETWYTNAETQLNAGIGPIDGQLKSLKGAEAAAYAPVASKQVQDLYQTILSSAPNPAAARGFQMVGARAVGYTLRDFGNVQGTQLKQANIDASQASRENSISSASNPNQTDEQLQEALINTRFQTNKLVSDSGWGPNAGTGMTMNPDGTASFDETTEKGQQGKAVYEEQTSKALAQIAKNRVSALLTYGNVNQAKAFLEKNKDWIPPEAIVETGAMIRAPLQNEQARDSATTTISKWDNNYNSAISGVAPKGNQNIYGAIHGQESNNNPNIGNSVDGAVGIGQVEPATFARFAKPGEDIHNPKDNLAVSNRYIDYLSNLPNVQGDPSRIAVGYFSGEKNIAPLGSLTPWINDAQDGNHKHVSSYVTDIMGRVGTGNQDSSVPASLSGSSFMTRADYYRQNYDKIVQDARDEDAKRPNSDATTQDLAAQRTEQKINDTIKTQELSDRTNRDTVGNYISGQNANKQPITNMSDLDNAPPEVKSAWLEVQKNDYYGASGIEKMVAANNRGPQKTFGTNSYKTLIGVLSRPGEVGYIPDDRALANGVGTDANSPLTNSGQAAISKELQFRDTSPQGRAWADSEKQFFQDTYKLGNPTAATGGFSQAFDKKYQDQIPTVLNQIELARQQGKSPTQLFSPLINSKPNPDYMGNHFQYPTRDDIEKERGRNLQTVRTVANNNFQDLAQHPEKIQTQEQLQSLIKAGLIKKDPKVLADIIRNNPNLSKKYIKQSDTQAPQVPFAQGLQ